MMVAALTLAAQAIGTTDVDGAGTPEPYFQLSDLASLGALGLEVPSPLYLLGSILFGIAGYVTFRRGRKTTRPELTWTGVALMVYPYAVSQTWQLWLLGAAMCGWVYNGCE
jgi:hypothetical protein